MGLKEVMRDTELPPGAKVLFYEINRRIKKKGKFCKTNRGISEIFLANPRTVSGWISILSYNEYINIVYIGDKRHIEAVK